MSETRATAESIRESARQVRVVYRAGRSLDGDDVGNVAHDLEDAAAEIARLTRELEEARERERAREQAAQTLCEIYFEIAADAIGEDEVRRLRDERIDALATPQGASDGTTRWHCEYGCGCVLDSRAARYHDCRRPASEGVRERVRHYLETELLLVREVLYIGSPHTRISTTIRSDQWDRWLDSHAAAIAALLSGSGTPPGEGERGLIMRAMLETFPWSPDIRQGHFERAADAVIAALRSAPTGETEGDRALWSDVDVRLSVLERLLYAEEGDSPDYRAVVSLRDRVLMKLRATPTNRSDSDD